MASVLIPTVAPDLQRAHFYIVPCVTLIKSNDVLTGINQTTDITMGKLFLLVTNNLKDFLKPMKLNN